MNEYQEMRIRHQNEWNGFPLGFAFDDSQFEKMMANWGLNAKKKEDLAKIEELCAGAYIRKSDVESFKLLNKRHGEELSEKISSDKTGSGFIRQMFDYELRNHEFGYTGEYEDTLDALGYTWKDIEADKRLKNGLTLAARKIMKEDI